LTVKPSVYTVVYGFEWDQAKSRATFKRRGFDFEFAARIFEGAVIEREDRRRDYGERRIVTVGSIEDDIFVVVYTWRANGRRIISARRASRRERDGYRKALVGANSQT
jgi:uncharacterized DUF497 family protein